MDRCVIAIVVLTIHSYILLSSRIDPCCGSSIMINKVCSAFWCMPLLPASGKFSRSVCGDASGHHRHSTGSICYSACSACRSAWGWCPFSRLRGVCTSTVFWQHAVLMGPTFHLRVGLHLSTLTSSIIRRCRSCPRRRSRGVIHIVCSSQVVFPSFPTRRKSSLLVFKGTKVAVAIWLWGTVRHGCG